MPRRQIIQINEENCYHNIICEELHMCQKNYWYYIHFPAIQFFNIFEFGEFSPREIAHYHIPWQCDS